MFNNTVWPLSQSPQYLEAVKTYHTKKSNALVQGPQNLNLNNSLTHVSLSDLHISASTPRSILRVKQWPGFNHYKFRQLWLMFITKKLCVLNLSSVLAFNSFVFSQSFKEINNQKWLTTPRRWATKLVRPKAKLRLAYEFLSLFCFCFYI
jgi:hypothetical protein